MGLEFYERITQILREGRRLAVATLIDTAGSTPRKGGARMALGEDGTRVESIGGGALEALVLEDCRALLRTGGSEVKEYFLKEGDDPGCTGMVCGGRVRVHLQVEDPPERLLIFGAGHVGAALARVAFGLGFRPLLLDDRPEYLTEDRLPPGVVAHATGPDFSGVLPPLDAATYVVIVSRCHRSDLAALRRVLNGPSAYLGMIGSRRKARVVLERLREEGFPPESLERIHTPIGVPIGACTPEEIAVSIAAELIQIRRGAGLESRSVEATLLPHRAERRRHREF